MSDTMWPDGWPDWPESVEQDTATMLEGCRGHDAEGNVLALQDGAVTTAGTTGSSPAPVLRAADGGLMYFPTSYAFHPGAQADIADLAAHSSLGNSSRRVFVVDTGWNPDHVPNGLSPKGHDIDPLTADVVHGHGPAIVSLIEQLRPGSIDARKLLLRQVRYRDGAIRNANGEPCFAVFPHPEEAANKHKPDDVALLRGFDSKSLMATLEALFEEDGLCDGDIVNLSLGALVDEESYRNDPVSGWVSRARQAGVHVVIAAGNHGTTDKSWPAADADGDLVISVGSGDDQSQPDKFSARDTERDRWITVWADGSDVPVVHPGLPQTKAQTGKTANPCNATWTGTSFAAPRVAASLM